MYTYLDKVFQDTLSTVYVSIPFSLISHLTQPYVIYFFLMWFHLKVLLKHSILAASVIISLSVSNIPIHHQNYWQSKEKKKNQQSFVLRLALTELQLPLQPQVKTCVLVASNSSQEEDEERAMVPEGKQRRRRAWSIYNKSALPASTRASSSSCAPKAVLQGAKVKERCSQMEEGRGSGCKLSAELAGTALAACPGWGV